MQTNNVQLRVTLSPELQTYLQKKASKFGLNMSMYVKHLILNDVKETEFPSHQASDRVVRAYNQALKERGEATRVKDINKFLNEL